MVDLIQKPNSNNKLIGKLCTGDRAKELRSGYRNMEESVYKVEKKHRKVHRDTDREIRLRKGRL